MYRLIIGLILCVVFMASGGALDVNNFESTMKFLSSAADPKTPLAMTYFLNTGEILKTDGDSTPKTPSSSAAYISHKIQNPANKNRNFNGLMETKIRQLSQIYDLKVSPTIYKESEHDHYDSIEHPDTDVPTRHLYPGRGKWAQKGDKHKPFVQENQQHNGNYRNHKQEKQHEKEGIDVYNRQKNYFKSRFSEPQRQRNKESAQYDNKSGNENDDQDEDDEFVPTRMYAQVRQYDHESHLPASVLEPRLRKIVKDSRIHTVYMEEGYEDGAYDHAGEEKQAEEDEGHEERHRRRKRHIDSNIPNVEIDTDFIGKNQYALGAEQQSESNKYPYYERKDINSISPLRYAQDMNDIPRKKEGNMAFYEEAEAKVKCEAVVDKVNPIPKELDKGDVAPEKTILPKMPRLKKLGDKIDCFKIKFFGEDPLDNPIFKEELIEAPKPLFIELKESENRLKVVNRTGKTFDVEVDPGIPRNAKYTTELTSAVNESAEDVDLNVEVLVAETGFQPLPEAEALRKRRLTRRRKRPYHHNKLYPEWYAYRSPYNLPPPYKISHRTTPLPPPQNTISEVYYKDQIKPSEQLNVFADVINHIQNMTRGDSFGSASEQHAHIDPTTMPVPSNAKIHNGTHRKKIKRLKYPVMKSTHQLYNEYMRRSEKNPSRIQDDSSEINVGTVQVPGNFDESHNYYYYHEDIEGPGPGPVHYSTIDIPVNKFLVPGMKPPLATAKPLIYSDFQTINIMKRWDMLSNHRLSRRKRATRNQYSEIRRQPARKPSQDDEREPEVDDDDDDDYVPHRPTNYHYDPETDRIIYDTKPETEDPVIEEIIEEEEEEEPEEVTTKRNVIPHRTVYHKDVLNKENGKTLVDFLAQLKSHPSYKTIEDPEPKKDSSVMTTTLKPVSTTPPEFLKFLEKLHNSEGYKRIEIEEDVKKKAKTTTTESPDVEEEEEEEEVVQVGNVQNSPGGQYSPEGSQLQIFDINDYLPKVKTYTPRTSIDYSKYKTIERTTSRHNLSSKYSEDDELPLKTRSSSTEASVANSRYQTAPPRPKGPPPPPEEEEEEENVEDEKVEEPIVTTTSTTTTTTTQAPKLRIRGRHRPTTRRPTRPTTKTTITTEATAKATEDVRVYTRATHRPPSRVYPRRQRPKIRLRSTTTSTPLSEVVKNKDDNEEESSEGHKRTIRRLDQFIPPNHKPDYTPLTISKRIDDHPIILVQRQPRLVTPEIINYNRTAGESRPGEINPRKIGFRRKVTRFIAKDKDRIPLKINNDDLDVTHKNTDRNDNSENVKFIKDPSKRLYYYASL